MSTTNIRAPRRLWTIDDISVRTGCPKKEIYRLIEAQQFPHPTPPLIREGRADPRYNPKAIMAWFFSVAEPVVKKPVPPGPTQLYRHFDADGRLLYVGISLSAILRFEAHRTGSNWAQKVATITIEHFPTRAEALAAEVRAIRTELPIHNIAQVLRAA